MAARRTAGRPGSSPVHGRRPGRRRRRRDRRPRRVLGRPRRRPRARRCRAVGPAPAGDPPERPAAVATLRTDGTCWTATFDGTSSRLADTKGLRYLAELIAEPGRERHALDLVDRIEGVQPGVDRRALGDAGPLLDARARAPTADGSRSCAPTSPMRWRPALDTAEARQAELDELVAPAGPGVRTRGPGPARGVGRRTGPTERHPGAALGDRRLADALPAGRRGARSGVRTGMYCVYLPARRDLRWIVQPGVNDGPVNERLQGMEPTSLHHRRRRDRRRHLPHLDLGPRREPGRLHVQPVPRRPARSRCCSTPACAGCSRWSPRRSRPVAPGRVAALDQLRPRRGRRVRGDEHVAGRRAAAARSPSARSAATCRSTTCATARHGHWPRARSSTSAASGCARSRRPTCPTGGRPRCCSRRRPERCCAATCSARSGGPALTTDDIVGPALAAEQHVPRHVPRPEHRRHAAELADLEPTHPGDHARRVVHRRRRPSPAATSPPPTTR